MNKKNSAFALFASLQLLSLAPDIVRADSVIAITNSPNNTGGGSAINSDNWKSLIFSTPSFATSEITSVQIGLGCGTCTNANYTSPGKYPYTASVGIDLYSVASGVPNTQIDTLPVQQIAMSSGKQMYTITIPNWVLAANTSYAIVIKSDSQTGINNYNFKWGYTGNTGGSTTTTPTGLNGYTYLGFKVYENGAWSNAATDTNSLVIFVFQQPIFTSVATNQNQMAVAEGLTTSLIAQNSVAGQAILNSFITMTAQEAQAVFNSISGEGISAQQTANFDATNISIDTVRRQGTYWVMDECQTGAGSKKNKAQFNMTIGSSCVTDDNNKFRSWVAGVGGSNSLNGSSVVGSSSVSTQTGGGLVGFDYEVSPNLLVGAMAGATSSNYNVSSLSSSGSVASGQFGVYSVARWNKFYVSSIFDYGYFSNASTRYVSGIGATTKETSSNNSNAFTGRMEVGYRVEHPFVNIMPFIAMQATSLQMGNYNESNTNNLGLSVQSKTVMSEPGSLGVQVDKAYNIDKEWSLYPLLRMAWIHEFQTDRTLTGSLQALPTGTWTVNGASAAANAADVGISLQAMNKDGFAFFASGNAIASSTSQGYTGQVGLKILF